jgi:transcriptional regulator with XRE-family HTH domain
MCCFLYRKLESIQQSIHIGKILQRAVKESGMNITVIARRAGYKRVTYYLHIKQPDLSFSILSKYAQALEHDFSGEIPGMAHQLIDEPSFEYNNDPKTLKEAKEQILLWKEKYYELLDKYVKVIENEKEKKN